MGLLADGLDLLSKGDLTYRIDDEVAAAYRSCATISTRP